MNRNTGPRRVLLLATVALVLNACQPADPPLTYTPPKAAPAAVPPAAPPTPEPAPVIQEAKPVTPSTPEPQVLVFPDKDGETKAAVVFEDMFPKRGDGDFNDFLTNFKIVERVNKKRQVTDIVIDFYPRAVGAWYDHSFLMVLNGVKDQPSNVTLVTKPLFNGDARITLTHFDAKGNVKSVDPQSASHDVVIFPSTHALFGTNLKTVINTEANRAYLPPLEWARLEISLADPALNPLSADAKIDLSRFRMMLHVKETKMDIDIIDVDPNNFDRRKNEDGYPYGFIIPADWKWPVESVDIGRKDVYPLFENYRMYLVEKAKNPAAKVSSDIEKWYKFPASGAPLYPAPEFTFDK